MHTDKNGSGWIGALTPPPPQRTGSWIGVVKKIPPPPSFGCCGPGLCHCFQFQEAEAHGDVRLRLRACSPSLRYRTRVCRVGNCSLDLWFRSNNNQDRMSLFHVTDSMKKHACFSVELNTDAEVRPGIPSRHAGRP